MASADQVDIIIDGRPRTVARGSTVAAAMLNAESLSFRASPSGETRAPLCGMGICFECRVTIDAVPHQRACMTVVREGMYVVTAGAPA
jgi:predicted molibdopterin-dependent oxidoreductase YjgC